MSEQRHRLFAENVVDVIWTMDFSGRVTYMSPSSRPLLGFAPEEYCQLTIEQMFAPASAAEAPTDRGKHCHCKGDRRVVPGRRSRNAPQGRLPSMVRGGL